jgi:hypothetical protein
MLKYVGEGYLIGIPARDLNEAEVEQFGGKTFLISTGLYADTQEAVPEIKPTKKIKTADEPAKEGDL